MTQLHPRDPENRQENRFSEQRFSEKTVTTGWMGKRGFISANNALLVAVDLIGEKNQVILEWMINTPTPEKNIKANQKKCHKIDAELSFCGKWIF